MGLAFLTTGVAFKIAAVPFHYWTPDAYQGSPTPVTGYLSVGPKIGAFAVILRVFAEALAPAPAGVADRLLRPGRPDDDARQPGGPHPGQRQADAGVLLDRPHRLHDGRPRRVRRGPDPGPRGAALLQRRLRLHEPRGVRGHHRAPEAPGRDQPARDVRRPRASRARAGDPDGPLPALADRDPANGRLLRQGLRDPGRGRRRAAG